MTKETIPIKIINIKLIKCNNRQLKFNTNFFISLIHKFKPICTMLNYQHLILRH